MTDREIPRIFVYGTLMQGFLNAPFLEGKVARRERGRVRGRLYHLRHRGYPAMLDGTDWIYGELLWLREGQKNLAEVDALEGYHGPGDPENLYNRVLRVVESLEDGTYHEAYVYMYNCRNRRAFERNTVYLPEGDWRAYREGQAQR